MADTDETLSFHFPDGTSVYVQKRRILVLGNTGHVTTPAQVSRYHGEVEGAWRPTEELVRGILLALAEETEQKTQAELAPNIEGVRNRTNEGRELVRGILREAWDRSPFAAEMAIGVRYVQEASQAYQRRGEVN